MRKRGTGRRDEAIRGQGVKNGTTERDGRCGVRKEEAEGTLAPDALRQPLEPTARAFTSISCRCSSAFSASSVGEKGVHGMRGMQVKDWLIIVPRSRGLLEIYGISTMSCETLLCRSLESRRRLLRHPLKFDSLWAKTVGRAPPT